jgi:hypothetical protein
MFFLGLWNATELGLYAPWATTLPFDMYPPEPPYKLMPLGIVAEFTLYSLEEVVGSAPFI